MRSLKRLSLLSTILMLFTLFSIPQSSAANQTITFTPPSTLSLAQSPYALVATASSGLTVTFISSTTTVCTVNGTSLTLVATGTCTLAANQAGNATYSPAPTVKRSITITKAAQTITFTPPSTLSLAQSPYALVATASSGLTVTFISSTTTVCTVNGTSLTLVATGTCTLAANQAGNATYSPAPTVKRSITITKAAQTITFTPPSTLSLAQSPYALVATSASGLAVSFASTTPTICTVAGASLTLVSEGTCSITASQAGNAIYAAASDLVNINVLKAKQTISTITPDYLLTISKDADLQVVSSSGLKVTLTSLTLSICTIKGPAVHPIQPGTCIIRLSQVGSLLYEATSLDQKINVKAPWKYVSAGWNHVCAISIENQLYCWGSNDSGQLGDGTQIDHSITRNPINLGTAVAKVSAGARSTCALTTSGLAYCWGANISGQLGDGTTEMRLIPTKILLDVPLIDVQIDGWENMGHACAITSTQNLYCWGRNADGELGDGSTQRTATPTQILFFSGNVQSIAPGSFHTCAVVVGGAGYCWGDGSLRNSLNDILSPRSVGSNLWSQIVSAYKYSCGVTTTGAAMCWGRYGALGVGDQYYRSTPTQVIGLESGVASISVGGIYSCALTLAGNAYCWGNTPSQVVQGSLVFVLIDLGWGTYFAISGDGKMYGWGSNSSRQIFPSSTTQFTTPYLLPSES